VQIRELLERKVDELPESYRTVFVMRSVEELTVDETAETLASRRRRLEAAISGARNLLRESLARDLDLAEPRSLEFRRGSLRSAWLPTCWQGSCSPKIARTGPERLNPPRSPQIMVNWQTIQIV